MSRLSPSSIIAPFVALALLGVACGDDDTDTAATTSTTDEVAEDQETGTEAEEDETEDESESEDDGGDATVDTLLEAVERTRAAESAVVELQLGFDGGTALGSQEATVSGPVALDGSSADLRVSINGQDDTLRFVVLGDRSFVGGDGEEVRGALPEGADWAELTTEQLLESPDFANPGDLAFLYLVGGAEDIEIDGSTYRFTVDMEAAVASAPAELRDIVAESLSFTGDEEPEITGEAELDDDGFITFMEIVGIQRASEEEAEALGLDPDTEIRVSIGTAIEDIDEPIEVQAPEGTVVPIAEAPDVAAMLGV